MEVTGLPGTATGLLHRQKLDEQVTTLRARVEKLRQENEDLKSKRDKNEKDTHEFVAYFQKEMEKKDNIVATLSDELTEKEIKYEREMESVKKSHQVKMQDLEGRYETMKEQKDMKIKDMEEELAVLAEYKQMKHHTEMKLEEKDAKIKADQEDHARELDTLERKYMEKMSKMKKEEEARVEQIKQTAAENAKKGLHADTKRIVADNRRMGEELRFQLQTTDELQRDKARVEAENKKLAREIAFAAQKEELYAKEGQRLKKKIQELKDKVKSLERSLSHVVRDFEKESAMVGMRNREQLEDQKLQTSGLKQLVKLKNRELNNVRQLAQVVLTQRTEVEQFFLDALEQVKQDIRQAREKEYRLAAAEYNERMKEATQRGIKFPAIRAPTQFQFPGGSLGPPLTDLVGGLGAGGGGGPATSTKVDLKDLGLEDRERVLRLLFAKLNNVSGFVDAIPSHAFQEPSDPAAAAAAAARDSAGSALSMPAERWEQAPTVVPHPPFAPGSSAQPQLA